MKKLLVATLMAAAFTMLGQTGAAQSPTTPPAEPGGATKAAANKDDFASEVTVATAQVKEKLDAGKTTAADLAENLKSINDLIVKHLKDPNREQLARLYLLAAHIYGDGLKDAAKNRAILNQVARDFRGTMAAQGAALSLAKLDAQAAADPDPNVPEGLLVGQKFPGFNETDLAGQPLSVAGHKGKVTLIDFWATWCGPCRAELPKVIALYGQYHAQGFDIIGVSLDQSRDALASFTQGQGMAWPQYFDGGGWDNKLAKKYGVNSIPMTYLLNRHGIIIGKGLRGAGLAEAVPKALANN
jgi:thiol-disulfide isomerase/thioredoxin